MGSDARGDPRVTIVPQDDGLALPEIGAWSRRKYHYLERYLGAFTTAMRGKWGRMYYIDLFAGAGFARIKDTSDVVLTSGAIAANLEHPFTELRLCDEKAANSAALKTRLERGGPTPPRQIVTGDANSCIAELLAGIPTRGALSVTFADPFGLHLDFDTVRQIAAIKSDLIILLADNMDAMRNWATYCLNNPDSNLDRFMGEPGWREDFLAKPRAEAMRTRYQEQLERLGYSEFAFERVQNDSGRDIYTLLFASRSPAGVKIWNNVSQVDEGGQRRLPY